MKGERTMKGSVHVRGEFAGMALRRHQLQSDPLRQLRAWLDDARRAGEPDAHAMTLATVTADGDPAARTVTLKSLDEQGLVFTSSTSAKTEELRHHSVAALVFYWPLVGRQVRLTGRVERTAPTEDAALYAPRSRERRLALKAFAQGRPVPDRETLDAAFEKRDRDEPEPVPRPEGWGGWRVRPATVEFWQGRERRLHDRFQYAAPDEEGRWTITRLAP